MLQPQKWRSVWSAATCFTLAALLCMTDPNTSVACLWRRTQCSAGGIARGFLSKCTETAARYSAYSYQKCRNCVCTPKRWWYLNQVLYRRQALCALEFLGLLSPTQPCGTSYLLYEWRGRLWIEQATVHHTWHFLLHFCCSFFFR